MGLIQSTVGVVSGIDYGTIVDSLIKLAQRPVTTLTTRNDTLKKEQVAVTELSAYLLTVRYTTDNLGKTEVFEKRQATSSNESALTATVTGTPAKGTYQFTPIQTARQQQLLSSGARSKTDSLGGGTVTVRFGDNVERSPGLDLLNGGAGIQRGKIRITDRSGASAEMDLTSVQTVDDVLDAINGNTTINVTATTHGGSIRLTDNTGGGSNLKVQEVGRGTTAASLGLAVINAAATVADGEDILKLTADTPLSVLNDGKGVLVSTVLPDISYTLRDGTSGSIDFSPLGSGGEKPQTETTLGDIVDAINAAAPGDLKAEIGVDGKGLVLTDLTDPGEGGGSFTLQSPFGSTALANLGLDRQAVGGVITGRQVVGGLKTVLLSSLNGGQGLGNLGSLQLTDRNEATDTADLSAASTLEDVIDAINAAEVGITARVNDAKNGILLSDTTGASTSHLIVADANVESAGTAAALNVAADTVKTSVNSGDLHLQVVSESTNLSDLNGGAGIALGKFTITTSAGHATEIDLAKDKPQTVGDLVKLINQKSGYVLAKINDTGDGIELIDLEHGSGTFRVAEKGSTTASDLHLLRAAVTRDYGGTMSNIIDGSMTQTIALAAGESLDDLETKINALSMGVNASTYNDGSSRPYRLALTSQRSGRLARFVVDTSALESLSLTETARARDALLAFGSSGSGAPAMLLASATNKFTGALPGVTLQITQPSATAVSITVGASDTSVVAGVQALIGNYNNFREKLNDDTKYNAATNTGAVLFGDSAALRLDRELSQLLTSRLSGAGSVQSLRELGISLKNDGTLALDEATLQAKFADDPQGVQDFFAKKDVGFSAKMAVLIEQMTGQDVSLMAHRFKALDDTIDRNQDTVDAMNKRLEIQRERLTAEFARVEVAISKMQSNMSILDSIVTGSITSRSSSSNTKSTSST
jgi:flagellar hook-associated protein 2